MSFLPRAAHLSPIQNLRPPADVAPGRRAVNGPRRVGVTTNAAPRPPRAVKAGCRWLSPIPTTNPHSRTERPDKGAKAGFPRKSGGKGHLPGEIPTFRRKEPEKGPPEPWKKQVENRVAPERAAGRFLVTSLSNFQLRAELLSNSRESPTKDFRDFDKRNPRLRRFEAPPK